MRKRFTIIFIALIIIGNFVSAFAAKSISDLTKEKNDIKNKASQAQSNLSETQEEKKSVLAQVEALDAQLSAVQEELDKLNTQLDETNKKLEENQNELEAATKRREEQYVNLKYRLRIMYENGSIGYLQVILEAKGFTDMLRRVEYINRIAEHDNNIFEEYKKTEALINEKVEAIKMDKENLELLTKQQQEKQNSLNESIKQKEELVTKLSQDEASYLQQLSDLDKADKEVSNLIVQAQLAQQQSNSSSGSNKVYASTGGSLQYPVPAYRGYNYNSPYGYRQSPISGKQEFHTGVDLKATMGTDIVAAESGTVIFSGNKGGYGKCVIIDHGNGLSTLYAHNSQLCVSVGQQVQRGQVISKAGTTGYSTGVHLHFEVRINGKHTNPAGYIGH